MQTKNSSPKNLPPKKSSQKNPPKNSSEKISHKKFLPKISSKKILQKNFQKFPPIFLKSKKSLKNSIQIPNNFSKKSKILRICDYLHRTLRPKTFSGLLFFKIIKTLLIQFPHYRQYQYATVFAISFLAYFLVYLYFFSLSCRKSLLTSILDYLKVFH